MATVFSCVGSSRVGDPPWMENLGSIAAIVLPYDATLCSGFAPCGQGPPGCFAARMSLIGPSGDAAATLVFIGGLAWCESSPCFQPLWMRLSAAMLAAVVDGFSELVDDGMMDLAAIVGDTVQRFCPSRARPSWMLCCEDVSDWAEWRCCCDAGFHWRLGLVRVKPLLSAFMDALVSCDAGRCGGWFL